MEALRKQMVDYYRRASRVYQERVCFADLIDSIHCAMEVYEAEHQDVSAVSLKARLHEEIADQCDPVIFPDSPFYFELGLEPSENWGHPANGPIAGNLLLDKRRDRVLGTNGILERLARFNVGVENGAGLWSASPFDTDHHSLNYTRLLKVGVKGILEQISRRLRAPDLTAEQRDFLVAAQRSNRAFMGVAERFADKAKKLLKAETGEGARRFLVMIAETAVRVPAEPPQTFYEGLACLAFLRAVTGTMEAIGVSAIGHLDRLLIGLYRNDLARGTITEETARDLLGRWMMPTDIKFHVDDNSWPESSTCMELGGCDEAGNEVFNELTRLIIDVHAAMDLVNPKLNCRISAASNPEYIELLAKYNLEGHNVFSLENDDVLVPANVKMGKTLEEARLYVNGGCQETIVEGVEHSAGGYYYFNLPRVIDFCLSPFPDADADTSQHLPSVIGHAETFESFYEQFMQSLKHTIGLGAAWMKELGEKWRDIHPCPLFSSGLAGCVENAKDYTAGGAAHNPSGICFVGLASLVDALYAVSMAVYREKWLSLEELGAVLSSDWKDAEPLRQRFISLPKYGHGEQEVDSMAARFCRELAPFVRSLPNERGETYQPSFFAYYGHAWFGPVVRATPDGRKAGELLSQGVGPARTREPESLTEIVNSVTQIDFTDYPGNAVLDVQLPIGNGLDTRRVASYITTAAKAGCPTLQLNVVSLDELRAAQETPDRYRQLTVRICGLSARFVALGRGVQDEIIGRAMIGA